LPSSTKSNGIPDGPVTTPLLLSTQREFDCSLIIGVVADTHLWSNGHRQFPHEVLELFERAGVGLILHAGDANDRSVIELLGAVAPVIAVAGNNDDALLQMSLARSERLTVGKWKLGMVHGHGGRSAREVAFETFGDDIDFVVYGHSHIPRSELRGSTVCFNPGSATDRRWHPHFGVGLIRCDEQGLHPEIILFNRPSDLAALYTRGQEVRESSSRRQLR
jgi:putative phosphoesterase